RHHLITRGEHGDGRRTVDRKARIAMGDEEGQGSWSEPRARGQQRIADAEDLAAAADVFPWSGASLEDDNLTAAVRRLDGNHPIRSARDGSSRHDADGGGRNQLESGSIAGGDGPRDRPRLPGTDFAGDGVAVHRGDV